MYRTDRNANLIAAAVPTGGGNAFTRALTAAGVAWTYGDPFPASEGGAAMSTIKILGNPIEGARAILAGSSALETWYVNHTGKAIMAALGIKNSADFAKAPRMVQDAVIEGIYRAEGGSGILLAPDVEAPPAEKIETAAAGQGLSPEATELLFGVPEGDTTGPEAAGVTAGGGVILAVVLALAAGFAWLFWGR